jgi:hypothetical protein
MKCSQSLHPCEKISEHWARTVDHCQGELIIPRPEANPPISERVVWCFLVVVIFNSHKKSPPFCCDFLADATVKTFFVCAAVTSRPFVNTTAVVASSKRWTSTIFRKKKKKNQLKNTLPYIGRDREKDVSSCHTKLPEGQSEEWEELRKRNFKNDENSEK